MDGFSISKIILGLQNPELYLKKLKNSEKVGGFEINSSISNSSPQPNQTLQNIQNISAVTKILQMNNFAGIDRAIFIKNLLGLPQNIWEILMNTQNPNRPINGGTLGLGGINQELLQNQKMISSLFNETAQIDNNVIATQNGKIPQDAVALFFSGMISLQDVSKLILQNSKQAVAALIISMASASKQGMSNEQLQETLSIINSCISMAESDNPTQTLKSLMLLYLPWLPLNEGVGFDLEKTPNSGENESNDSKLTVLIQTKNFGNVKGVFTLTTSNSVDIYIICSESFPKKILLDTLNAESSSHAMNTNIDIEAIQPAEEKQHEEAEAKVNLSATNEMNPYLLLMAHAFIRNTIVIDNQALYEST